MKAAGVEMATRYIKVLDVLQCLFKSIKHCVAWFICEKGCVGNQLLFPVVRNVRTERAQNWMLSFRSHFS